MSRLFAVEQSEKTSDDYLTPAWVFDALGLTFDLDVAAPPWDTHVPAARKFTKADDGLSQEWTGRVWMNPPYSQATAWADKFIAHGHGIALLPWAKAAWTIRLWDTAHGIALPPPNFEFEGRIADRNGGHIRFMCLFAAFGDECVAALHNLGGVRTLASRSTPT